MKQFYTFLAIAATSVTFAQQTISFEGSEGFQLATVNDQNGWSVTGIEEGGFIENQVISNEEASQGTYSLKNAQEDDFESQAFPIIGATKSFETPLTSATYTVSFDVFATELDASNFEFNLYGVEDEIFKSLPGITLDYTGDIYITSDGDYGLDPTQYTWEANEWINFRIEATAETISYYKNDVLMVTIENFLAIDVVGFTLLHDNYGGDAYYDTIVITSEDLSTTPFDKNSIAVYPNPAKDLVSLTLPNNTEVSEVVVYNVTGQEVLRTNQTQNINVSDFANGAYFLKATTTSGATLTKKIIKN